MSRNLLLQFGILFTMAIWSLQCELPLQDQGADLEPLPDGVKFSVGEAYADNASSDPIAAISIFTRNDYPCANYKIVYSFDQGGRRLAFNLKGVTIGPICLGAFGPASLIQKVGLENGTHQLRITIGSTVNTHTLLVTDSAFQIINSEPGNSNPIHSLFWRLKPRSFVFGCNSFEDVEDSWTCNAFLDTLKKNMSLTEFFRPTDGVWPYDQGSRYFLYANDEEFDRAGELLKAFSKRYLTNPRSAAIILKNWRNKSYLSWELRNQ